MRIQIIDTTETIHYEYTQALTLTQEEVTTLVNHFGAEIQQHPTRDKTQVNSTATDNDTDLFILIDENVTYSRSELMKFLRERSMQSKEQGHTVKKAVKWCDSVNNLEDMHNISAPTEKQMSGKVQLQTYIKNCLEKQQITELTIEAGDDLSAYLDNLLQVSGTDKSRQSILKDLIEGIRYELIQEELKNYKPENPDQPDYTDFNKTVKRLKKLSKNIKHAISFAYFHSKVREGENREQRMITQTLMKMDSYGAYLEISISQQLEIAALIAKEYANVKIRGRHLLDVISKYNLAPELNIIEAAKTVFDAVLKSEKRDKCVSALEKDIESFLNSNMETASLSDRAIAYLDDCIHVEIESRRKPQLKKIIKNAIYEHTTDPHSNDLVSEEQKQEIVDTTEHQLNQQHAKKVVRLLASGVPIGTLGIGLLIAAGFLIKTATVATVAMPFVGLAIAAGIAAISALAYGIYAAVKLIREHVTQKALNPDQKPIEDQVIKAIYDAYILRKMPNAEESKRNQISKRLRQIDSLHDAEGKTRQERLEIVRQNIESIDNTAGENSILNTLKSFLGNSAADTINASAPH